MSKDIEIEPYYARRAQELVDLLTDKGFLRNDVSREEGRVLEEYIAFLMQSDANSIKRAADLLREYKEK